MSLVKKTTGQQADSLKKWYLVWQPLRRISSKRAVSKGSESYTEF
jgi:hypothetical protein